MASSLRGSSQDVRAFATTSYGFDGSQASSSGSDSGADAGGWPNYFVGWDPAHTAPPFDYDFAQPTHYVPTFTRDDFETTSSVPAWNVIRILIAVVALVLGLMRWQYYRQQRKERMARDLAAQEDAHRTAFAAIVASPSKSQNEPAARSTTQ